MAYDRIQSRVNHFLSFLYLTGSGKIGVFTDYFGIEQVCSQEDDDRNNDNTLRKMTPTKSEIQS